MSATGTTGGTTPNNYTAPFLCHVSETPQGSGAYHRNQTRMGALQFNGWYPNESVMATLDYSNENLAKGLFNFWYGAPVTIGTRAKWGSPESLHPFDEIYDYTTKHWFAPGDPYLVKHFRGSGTSYLIDVKFYLKVEFYYWGLHFNPAPGWLNARKPEGGIVNGWKTYPPWTVKNKAITQIKWRSYAYTSTVWVPASGGVAGYYRPDKDYWREITENFLPGTGTTYEEVMPYGVEKPYSERSTYLAEFAADGWIPWDNRDTPSNEIYFPTPAAYIKETGTTLDSSDLTWNYYTGNPEDQYQTWYYGLMCRDPDAGAYDLPDDKYPFIATDGVYSLAAYHPEANTLCYNWYARKMRIKVYAKVDDTCHFCYYQGLDYNLSIGYKQGTCKLEAEGNGPCKIVLDLQTSSTEDFTVQIPEPVAFQKDYLVKTIEWDLAPGQGKRITDFKLTSLTNA